MSQAVPSQSTASAFYQNTARPKVSKAVLSQSTARPYFQKPVFSTSTGRPYYPRMDNVRPRTSSSSPTRFFNTRTVDRPKSPKPIIKFKWVKKESTAGTQAVLPQTKGEKGSVVASPTQTWRPKRAYLDHRHKNNGSYTLKKFEYGNPEEELKDHAIIDSGCSGSMTGDKDKLSDFKDCKGGYICDKKHNVLFTDSECLILSPEFKIVDENLVLLRAPRKNDVYSLNLKNIIPSGGVTCLVARIEAIRLFLAFASFMGFSVYQMDVKSAFLYGNITEEVYVNQPPGFVDPHHPNKVYKVIKALYGLHQAPRAWYERLSTFLLKHGYRRGAIDKTLFIKRDRKDIMLVQVYVDDIIFGSTKTSMVKEFEELMQKEFKMSSMGELTFFLGLQVKQSTAGIFISQDKYVKDILNKFDFRTIKPATTPIEAHKALGKDEEGEDVDVHLYRSMIGCLMYLTASRPDIMFAVCLCARFQVTPKVSHMHAVKRIFRRLVSWQCKKQTIVAISSTEAEYVAAASCCGQIALIVLTISPKFSGKLTPLTPSMLEVANAVRDEHPLNTEELDITTSSLSYFEGSDKVHVRYAEGHEGNAKVYEGIAEVIQITEPSMKEVKMKLVLQPFKMSMMSFIQDDTLNWNLLVNFSKTEEEQELPFLVNIPSKKGPKSPTLTLDPKDKGKGIMKEEPKKKKLTLQQLRAAETANDEEFARRVAAEWERGGG
ncbi:putative ribonuclease H-like domain-containing protein [Tanacetum coccineum]